MGKSAATKARILEVSIRLFNALGTGNVSTNRIAATAGMSPGNLYYHFASKTRILLAVFERIEEELSLLWVLPGEKAVDMGYFRSALSGTFRLMWEHRFFQRELNILLHMDEELKERYLALRDVQNESLKHFFAALAEEGVLSKPSNPEVLENLLMICRMIIDFWLSEADLEGRPVNSHIISEGVNLALESFRPYLTTEAYSELIQAGS